MEHYSSGDFNSLTPGWGILCVFTHLYFNACIYITQFQRKRGVTLKCQEHYISEFISTLHSITQEVELCIFT